MPVEEVGSLEWIRQRQEASGAEPLQGWEKLKFKVVENPFVPLGVLGTCYALVMGLKHMKTGDRRKSQLMMRLRVGCQAFAIGALLVGVELKRRKAIAESESESIESNDTSSQIK